MKDKLKLLIKLQKHDNKISDILKKKNEGPKKIQKLEEEIEAFEEQWSLEKDRLNDLKKERLNIETDIREMEAKIEKSNEKLSSIKSNKEYKAVLKEIENLKKGKAQIEDRALELMEQIDDLGEKCLNNSKRQSELSDNFKKDKIDIEKKIKELSRQLEKFEKERNHFSTLIDKDLLKKYHFLKERKSGQAVSSVENGFCRTCNMELPPQKYNELLKGNSLLTCPYCNRIIYWEGEVQFQELAGES